MLHDYDDNDAFAVPTGKLFGLLNINFMDYNDLNK